MPALTSRLFPLAALVALAVLEASSAPLRAATWTAGASMLYARAYQGAFVLPNGRVLVAGGNGATAEVFDPATGSWTNTGSMSAAHGVWVQLHNGHVLAMVGAGTTSEIYDPAGGTWSQTGPTVSYRSFTAAVVLQNGKVLLVGGRINENTEEDGSTAELYDPEAGTWALTGSLSGVREYGALALLPDGKVLVAGGYSLNVPPYYLSTAEVYDPDAGTWSVTGSLPYARGAFALVTLRNGKVLAEGGLKYDSNNNGSNALVGQLYDPSSGSWSDTGTMSVPHDFRSALLLPDGRVLVAGESAATEIYDPASGSWSGAGSLTSGRSELSLTLLPDGRVMAAGGYNGSVTGTVDFFVPGLGAWTATGRMTSTRCNQDAVLLPSGKVLLVGGKRYPETNGLTTTDLYDPQTGAWTSSGALTYRRLWHTTTLLPNGRVLVTGGFGGNQRAELYDPGSGLWVTTQNMSTTRQYHTATLLGNGKVLVAGGFNGGNKNLTTAELYDPAAGTWSPTGAMNEARSYHTATRLADGRVLVAGGEPFPISQGNSMLSSAELYDPVAGTWATTAPLASARTFHTAGRLPDGRVLVSGGADPYNGDDVHPAELYDPAAGTWFSGATTYYPWEYHTATMLPSGKVLHSGYTGYNVTEMYDPSANTWTQPNSVGFPGQFGTATLLPNGRILRAGGELYGGQEYHDTAELMPVSENDYHSASPPIMPVIQSANGSGFPAAVQPGTSVTLAGVRLSAAGSYAPPVVLLRPNDTGGEGVSDGGGVVDLSTSVAAHAASATSLTFDIPPDFPSGWYQLSLQVNGVPSDSVSLLVAGSGTVPPTAATAFQAADVGVSTLSFSWNDIQPAAQYLAQISSDCTFSSILASSITANQSAAFDALDSFAGYCLRVSSTTDGNGPWSLSATTMTRVASPAVSLASATTSSLVVTWGTPSVSTVAAYVMRLSTSPSFSVLNASATVDATVHSVLVKGLAANARYYGSVVTVSSGVFSAPGSGYLSTLSLPVSKVALLSPSSTTLSARWATKDSTTSVYALTLATAPKFNVFTASGTSAPGALVATVGGLDPNTLYYGEVAPVAENGTPAQGKAAAALATLPAPPAAVTLDTPTLNSLTCVWSTVNGPKTVYQVQLGTAANFIKAAATATSKPGMATLVVKKLKPNTTYFARVTALALSGRKADNALSAASAGVATAAPITAIRPAPAARTKTAGAPAPTAAPALAAGRVYPNPFRPAAGHVFVTFDALPAGTTLRIYDAAGESIRELAASAAGRADWDAKNGSGADVASGVYFARAEAPGGGRRLYKIAIQR